MRPVFEVLVGPVDGSNRLFRTTATYKPNTVQVWVNGLLRRADLSDGWVEKGGTQIELKEPPRDGDVVQAYYQAV